MSENKESGESIALGCLLFVLCVPFGIALQGFVLKMLWGWFIVPLGAPSISWAHAWDLAIIVSMTAKTAMPPDKDKFILERGGIAIIVAVVSPLFALFAGYLASLLM
jgi:hypothetical protein